MFQKFSGLNPPLTTKKQSIGETVRVVGKLIKPSVEGTSFNYEANDDYIFQQDAKMNKLKLKLITICCN